MNINEITGAGIIREAAISMALMDWIVAVPPRGVRYRPCKSPKWERRRNKAFTRWDEQQFDLAMRRKDLYADLTRRMFGDFSMR